MNWILLLEVIYSIILALVCLRIIYDTRGTSKTLAYLLGAIFLPILGIIIYFSFGINYRKRKMYRNKSLLNSSLRKKLKQEILESSNIILDNANEAVQDQSELIQLLLTENFSPLTKKNKVDLLINGEQKFPEVINALKKAKEHIHVEYYIFNDDSIGNIIADLLIKKAKEGIKVRFIYDDYGSSSIRKKVVPKMREAGIDAFPFYKIKLIKFANRVNYRNHRKMIVVDGKIGFVGGINVSDQYINKKEKKGSPFWRDTHFRLEGPSVNYIQYIFLTDWHSCSEENLILKRDLYNTIENFNHWDNKLVQLAASGPDSDSPTIMYSLLQAVNLAKKEILITTPYFIPGESLLDALNIAALSGLKVKLLVPYKSDSKLVNAASMAYYGELLSSGVEIYRYKKGFVHAKTIVTDSKTAIVGTANMDNRSFQLNFEVNAIVYDKGIAQELRDVFYTDLKDAEQIDLQEWLNRPWYKELSEKTAKLFSPML